jgi:site-specific recombinase XerD
MHAEAFYNVTLQKDWDFDLVIPTPKKTQALPVVLSPEEVRRFLDQSPQLSAPQGADSCYAAGMRISDSGVEPGCLKE